MSYLHYPRLAFSGLFQADVSTVNNDPRHFDNQTFEPYFQKPEEGQQFNGWWNPLGTGIFGLKNCIVQSALGPDGKEVRSAGEDAAIGLVVGNTDDQPSGKMVDLDPDWQLASCIYGQTITLRAANGQVLMRGDYEPNPFRDLWFNRVGNLRGDSAASAIWQTILSNVSWNLDAINSPLLQELKTISESQGHTLSLRMSTYGYDASLGNSFFSYGLVLGAIGPAYPVREPASFVLGRRFIPAASLLPASAYPNAQDYFPNVGWFSAQIADNTLYVDLSNALPLAYTAGSTLETSYQVSVTSGSGSGNPNAVSNGDPNQQYWQQPFIIAQLNSTELPSSPYLQPNQYQPIASVDISNASLLSRSGIAAVPIPDSLQATITQLPLALITSGNPNTGIALLLCCEGAGGWEVRAEEFALRLDPNGGYPDPVTNANETVSAVYVAQYGVPLSRQPVSVQATAQPPQVDTGDCPTDNPPQTTPKAAPPTTNAPAEQVRFAQLASETSEWGRVDLRVSGPAQMGYPRYYMDGQLFNYNYNFAPNSPNGASTVQQPFDQYAIVVRSTYVVPDPVTWEDVQPILQQYANLYPVMSQGLFDFSKKEQADANAFILKFVLEKPMDDPDQMPVTRDLSNSKRRALIAYFNQVIAGPGRPKSMLDMFGKRCPTRGGGERQACPEPQEGLTHFHGGKGDCPAK